MKKKNSISLISSSKFNKKSFIRNRISFLDRTKIKNLQLQVNKLDEQEEKYLYQYDDEDYINKGEKNTKILNLLKQEKEDSIKNESKIIERRRSSIVKLNQKRHIKYRLKDLMILNPYHYVPKSVMFGTNINNNLISNKINEGRNIPLTIKLKKNNKKEKVRKVFNSQSICFPEINFKKDELIWRLIGRIMILKGVTSFKQAVKYEAITKVWKTHSLIIEKLLVNYQNCKWFLEREKILNENVFMELLSLLKLTKNGGVDFCKKIFLIFDNEGYGNIKIKEFFFLMDITSQSTSTMEKIHFIVNLFEDYERIGQYKSVNIEEIIDNFKYIINYDNYKKDYKRLIDTVKNEFIFGRKIIENSEENYFEKTRIITFLLNNKYIQMLIKKFYNNYSKAHKTYDEQIMNVFNTTMRNSKRMLNIHDIVEYCESDLKNIEEDLIAIENKERMKLQLLEFKDYLNDDEK